MFSVSLFWRQIKDVSRYFIGICFNITINEIDRTQYFPVPRFQLLLYYKLHQFSLNISVCLISVEMTVRLIWINFDLEYNYSDIKDVYEIPSHKYLA